MIFSNTPSWYFLQYHQRYSLQYATYPRQHTVHRHPSMLPAPTRHITHASYSFILARHPRQHATNANTPPSLTSLPRKHVTHDTHANTNSTPFLKLLGIRLSFSSFQLSNSKRKFSSFYFQFLLLQPLLQAFLNIFMEVWKTTIEKLVFLIQKTTIFFKSKCTFFKKRLLT